MDSLIKPVVDPVSEKLPDLLKCLVTGGSQVRAGSDFFASEIQGCGILGFTAHLATHIALALD